MLKSYKFRLFPSRSQTTKLEHTLELCRELYNAALSQRRNAWKLARISITYLDQQNVLPEIKAIREDIAGLHSQVLQDVLAPTGQRFQSVFYSNQERRESGLSRDSKAKIGTTVSRTPKAALR